MKKCGGFLAFLMFKAQEVADFFGGKDDHMFIWRTTTPVRTSSQAG